MQRALGEYRIEGIETNLNFFREVLDHPDFRKGEFDTGFIERWLQNRMADTAPPQTERDLAVIAAILCDSPNPAHDGISVVESNPSDSSRLKRLQHPLSFCSALYREQSRAGTVG